MKKQINIKAFLRRRCRRFLANAIACYQRVELEELKLTFHRVGPGFNAIAPWWIKNPQYISIGCNFRAMHNLRLEAWDNYNDGKFIPELVIGDDVCVNSDVHIGCVNKIRIGARVLIASKVFITDHFHGHISGEDVGVPPIERPLTSKGPTLIGDDVWIAEGVCILPGVTVGTGAIVGANAVVTRDVEPHTVVGGIPARSIKRLKL